MNDSTLTAIGIAFAATPLLIVLFAFEMSGLETMFRAGLLPNGSLDRYVLFFGGKLAASIPFTCLFGVVGLIALVIANIISILNLVRWYRQWSKAKNA